MSNLTTAINDAFVIEKAAGIVIENAAGQILMIMRNDMPIWELVGGMIDEGENCADAIEREAMEEIGCEIIIGNYLGSHYRTLKPNGYRRAAFYNAMLGSNKIILEEHVAFEWFDKHNLPENTGPLHRFVIENVTSNSFEVVDKMERMQDFIETVPVNKLYGLNFWKNHPCVEEKRRMNQLKYDPSA